MDPTRESAWARAPAWLLESLRWLFGPFPGSRAHLDLFYDTIRLRGEEARKPDGERDEARLLHLTKEMLRLRAERNQVSQRLWLFSRQAGLRARTRQSRPPWPVLFALQRSGGHAACLELRTSPLASIREWKTPMGPFF